MPVVSRLTPFPSHHQFRLLLLPPSFFNATCLTHNAGNETHYPPHFFSLIYSPTHSFNHQSHIETDTNILSSLPYSPGLQKTSARYVLPYPSPPFPRFHYSFRPSSQRRAFRHLITPHILIHYLPTYLTQNRMLQSINHITSHHIETRQTRQSKKKTRRKEEEEALTNKSSIKPNSSCSESSI